MKIVQKLFIFVSVIVLCAGCTPKQTEETNQNTTQTTQNTTFGHHHPETHHNDHHWWRLESSSLFLEFSLHSKYNDSIMKKTLMMIILGVIAISCTNTKLVQYNTDRLDRIEAYLGSNEMVQDSAGLEKLKRDGQIKTVEKYKSLEREADAWSESQ